MSWAGGFKQSWDVNHFADLKAYLSNLQWTWRPSFIVLHNTGTPTLVRWRQTDELDRQKNLEHYYRDQQGWEGGPHFFVSPTRILQGTPANLPGRHSPSWNHCTIGIEMAGDYDVEPFDPDVKRNAVVLMAMLHSQLGLDPADYKLGVRGLHFHKEDVKTQHKRCPGKNVDKPSLIKAVLFQMHGTVKEHDPNRDEAPTMPESAPAALTTTTVADAPLVGPGRVASGQDIAQATQAPASPLPPPVAALMDASILSDPDVAPKLTQTHREAVARFLSDPQVHEVNPMTIVTTPASIAEGFAQMLGKKSLDTGDQGSLVEMLQHVLVACGYPVQIDGRYGPTTDTAVRDVQHKAKVTEDGEVGPITARILIDRLKVMPTVQTPGHIVQYDPQPIWLTEGLRWINTKEVPGPGDNPKILDWAKDIGGDIGKDYKHDATPWCALFANMILNKCGLPGTGTLWALDFNTTKSLITLPGPAVGAFAPMHRPGGGHIICVVGRDQHGNLMGLGGNQKDEVSVIPFPKDRPASFRWPKSIPLPTHIGFDALPVVMSDGRVSNREA